MAIGLSVFSGRQYLFDTGETVRLDALQTSKYIPLRDAAAKIKNEEIYHQRHARAWVQRLGLGTEESNHRMQTALNDLWPYALQLFTPVHEDPVLIESGYIPDSNRLRTEWEGKILPFLRECELALPHGDPPRITRQEHTPHLNVLVTEMQSVAKLEPGGEW
jgi:ring-1,2-phenylacetyl-CoA epoxidase subunit PaaC